jgi:U2-associated protein SR140
MGAMGFAIDHSESSLEIVTVVVESLSLAETPVTTKIARLFLVSGIFFFFFWVCLIKVFDHEDILHNCTAAVPNASSYRSLYVHPPLLLFHFLAIAIHAHSFA